MVVCVQEKLDEYYLGIMDKAKLKRTSGKTKVCVENTDGEM